jgi:hypothetical protein
MGLAIRWSFVARFCFVVVVVVIAHTSPASAQSASDLEAARDGYEQGVALRKQGKFDAALPKLKAAHVLANAPTTGLELAQCYNDLGRLVEARAAALSVARIPTAASSESPTFRQARTDAAQLAADLHERIPSLTIVVSGMKAGATVKIDDKRIDLTALAVPLRLDPDRYEVVVTSAQGTRQKRNVELQERDAKTIAFTVSDSSDNSGDTTNDGPTNAEDPNAKAPTTEKMEPERPNDLTLTLLLPLFGGEVAIEYERGLGRWLSLYAAPSAIFGSGILLGGVLGANGPRNFGSLDSVLGGGIDAGARIFITGIAPRGLWVGPDFAYKGLTFKAGKDTGSASEARFGAMAGYTFIKGGFVLSSGLGIAGASTSVTEQATNLFGGTALVTRTDFGPEFLYRLSIGAAF